MTTVSNAQQDTTSIKTEYAVKSKELANSSILSKVFARSVMRDIPLLMVDAQK